MKSSMNSGHVVHLSERSDDGMIIVHQVVGMAKAALTLRRDSPLSVSR
jgi:DNA-binding IclR family transcriptional regulator